MTDPTGFLKYERIDIHHLPVVERIRHYQEFDLPHPEDVLVQQAARCMDCGTPFCHAGCPVLNRIPEFNDLVHRGRWREAFDNLHSTNNFPEITGRVCPAPCEAACTLAVNSDPVLIKHIEYQIAERGFAEGWVQPRVPATKTGLRVRIVGSGPAGLAAAQQLARAGHDVTVFEKDDRVGGLLRYGIPDFKLSKSLLDRRIEQLVAEGVTFETGVTVGEDISARYLRSGCDAICLAIGASVPRALVVPGAGYDHVHPAMEYLTQQNRILAGDPQPGQDGKLISASGKVVVVIGGGDTGSDCVGTAIRQGAKEVHQWEILPRPPETRNPATPWPLWPQILRTSSSQEEGCQRRWSVLTKRISGVETRATEVCACEVQWTRGPKGWVLQEKPNTEFSLKADLILLAMGFLHVQQDGIVSQLDLQLDPQGNVAVQDYMTSLPGVFAAGDSVRGASLVVHAIYAGRQAAAAIHRWLTR